jgi:YaiO family outer membrane protein
MKSYGMVNFQADNVNRFHTRDQAFSLAYGYPFKYGILNFEGSYAANPNFLPETTAAVRWEGTLPAGFGYIVGANQKQYAESFSNAYTNMLSLGAEKYIGDFRFAYIGGISTINKTESSYSQKLQAQWVGDSKNQLGVAYTWGMIPTVIYLSNLGSYYVKYISLNGMYWLNKSTAITSALWHGAEGDYFQLNGAQLGLRYNF